MIEQLISAAHEGVERRRRAVPQAELEGRLRARDEDRPFSEALVRPGLSLIAEFKRRSPSAGEIAAAEVGPQVQAYERGGAAALGEQEVLEHVCNLRHIFLGRNFLRHILSVGFSP